ncbi:MAG TPA: molecular chaperone DnaK [Gammaproteobacteria bacterium]|nr:molecular chaperone DnaK [Gammaproteobacteria bacterium]
MDNNYFKKLLQQRRAELLAVQESGHAAADTVELDQCCVGRLSRMDAMQVQAMLVEADRRRGQEIRRIDAALQRLEEDDYGMCEECEMEIAKARLEYDPSTLYCIECASKLEQKT